MGPLLLLLLIFFVIIPLVRASMAIYRARRAARKFFDQFRQPSAGGAAAKSPEPGQPKAKSKKINPEDGEFVSFEDLPADASAQENTIEYQSVTIEQQIVDVEWEDIK